jgi:hypothetical protein
MKCLFVAAATCIALGGAARAASPVAVVEDVQGKVTGAEFMDYVVPGQVIKLGPGGKIVLGYMKSCWQETISGVGTVIVGAEESAVHLAEFTAKKVPCDPSQSRQVGKEYSESAAALVRSLKEDSGPPPLVLHGVSPIIATSDRGKLVVERLDVKGEHYEMDVASSSLTHNKFVDLARTNIALKPGGTYAAAIKSKRVVFKVDPDAGPGAGAVIGRLVSLR